MPSTTKDSTLEKGLEKNINHMIYKYWYQLIMRLRTYIVNQYHPYLKK
jgi:hypothetical protein